MKVSSLKSLVTAALVIGSAFAVTARETRAQDGGRDCVVMPDDYAVVTIAQQPDSPLRIESAQELVYLNRDPGFTCEIRNTAKVPVRAYEILVILSNGARFGWGWRAPSEQEVILPGQTIADNQWGATNARIVPLTQDLRSKLKLDGPFEAIFIAMIVSAEMSDGTVYRDERLKKALFRQFHVEG